MIENQVSSILKVLASLYPDARTQLKHDNPFQLLIATILSAQATDKQVNKITRSLFTYYNSPQDFLSLTQEDLAQLIRGCGLYKTKSGYIQKTCAILLEKYGGEVPKTREELMTLPGVGRKTANVILSVAFQRPAIAVDTHVYRLARRLGLAQSKKIEEVEEELMTKIPKEKWSELHHWLIYHGRKVCLARRPNCTNCLLISYCLTGRKMNDE